MEKEAFWTLLKHKSEENGKVTIFLAGTVPDGVKHLYMMASRVTKWWKWKIHVTIQSIFKLMT